MSSSPPANSTAADLSAAINSSTPTPPLSSTAAAAVADADITGAFSTGNSSAIATPASATASVQPPSSSSASNASTPSTNTASSSSAALIAAANASINALSTPDASSNNINEFFNILNKSQNLVPKDVSNITKDPVLIDAYQKILFFNPDGTYQEAVNSCQRCRKLKKKCTKHKPKCLNCFKTNYECIYIERSQDGNYVSTFTSGDNYLNTLAPNQYIIKDTVSHVGSLGQVGQQLIENHARGIVSKNIPIPQGSHTKRIKPATSYKINEKSRLSPSTNSKSFEANDPLLFSSPNVAQLYHGIIDQASKIRKSSLSNVSTQASSSSNVNLNSKKSSSSLLSQSKSAGPDLSSYPYSSILASVFPSDMNIFQENQSHQDDKKAVITNTDATQEQESSSQINSNGSSMKISTTTTFRNISTTPNITNSNATNGDSSNKDGTPSNADQSVTASNTGGNENEGASEVPGVPSVTGSDKNVIDEESIDPSLFQ